MPNFRAGGRVASILMVFRAVSWKAAKLISVTFLGIVISVSSLLPAKACWLIVSRFSGKCISLSPASAKARIPISLIVLGRCKVLRLLHSSKALLGIEVKESFSGSVTSFSAVQPAKAPSPIEVIELGSLIVSNLDTFAKLSLERKTIFS